MHYVGLSRVTLIENLHITYLNEKKMSLSPVVLEEMNRLRTEEKLNVCIDNLAAYDPYTTVLASFNIRSLHKHKEDLEKDLNLMSSDVLAIFETRLVETDEEETLSLPGYTMHRFDSQKHGTQRPSCYLCQGITHCKKY